MLRNLKSEKAQIVASEYVIMIALIVAFLTSMTVYVNRALQAKIRNSAKGMIGTIRGEVGYYYNGVLYYQYEPYYMNTVADMSRSLVKTDIMMQDGITQQDINSFVSANVNSVTAPSKDYD